MKVRFVVTACSAAVIALAFSFSTPASAQDAKACGKQWSAMSKAEKKGLKKKDYVANCVAKTPTAPAAESKKSAQPSTTTTGAKGKAGRQAMIERERACGKEWREAKAAGKIEKGQTWPKYWSACNTRMKQRGM